MKSATALHDLLRPRRDDGFAFAPILLPWAMQLIVPPQLPDSHPDRLLACEKQLEGALTYLADSAKAAGWGAGEIDLALLNLALARLKAADANLDVDDAIRRANAMVGDTS